MVGPLVGKGHSLIVLVSLVIRFVVVVLFSRFFSDIEINHIISLLVVDFVSLAFVILSVFVSFLSLVSMIREKNLLRVVFFFCLMNFLLVRLFGFSYLFTFFVILELSIIPIFIILGYWGVYKERFYSSYYFIFYSFITPIPLLLCIRLLIVNGDGFCYFTIGDNLSLISLTKVEIVGLLVRFLAKLPLYRLHIWLPKAHVDAPVRRSIVLAGILLKIGAYRLIRLLVLEGFLSVIPIFFICLRVLGCLLCGVLCVRLVDFKVVVAFSSVCHIGMGYRRLVPLKMWRI